MSSDADSTLPYEYPTGAFADTPLGLGSDTANDIADAFHNMSIHTPTRLSPDGATIQATEVVYAVSFPDENIIRDAHHFSLAQGTAPGGLTEAGPTQPQPDQRQPDTHYEPSADGDDLCICPTCTSEQAYCHCQPNPPSTSPSPLPIPPLTTSPQRVGQIELNREQAKALVAQFAASLDTHHKNSTVVQGEREPPPKYPARSRGVDPELMAQGVKILDVPIGRHQGGGHQ
jgi:hypothetical protein